MPSTRSLVATASAAAIVVVLLVTAGAPAAGAPPPEDVCGTCGQYFERAVADAGGPDVAVEATQLDVRVSENGSAQFLARNALAPAEAAWVANNTDAVATALGETDAGLAESKHALSVRVVDDVAVVEYVDESFAYRSLGGVVVADALTRTTTGWAVNAQRFVMHAPGTHVTASHDRGESVAEWTDYVDDEHVVFSPGHGPASAAAAQFALVAATAPAFLRSAAVVLVPFVGVLAVLFRSVDSVAELTPTVDARTAASAAVAAGALVALALVATGRVSLYFVLPGAAPLFTAFAAVAAGGVVLLGARGATALSLAAVGVPLSVGVVAAFVGAFAHPAVAGWTIVRALAAGCLAAQVGVFAVLGATRGGERRRWLRFAAATSPVVAVVALLGPSLVVAAWALVLAALAPAAYVFGAAVGENGLRSV